LAENKAAVITPLVDMMRVPFPEQDVRTLVDRVEMIMRTRVEGQFLQAIPLEGCLIKDYGIGLSKKLQGTSYNRGVLTWSYAYALKVQRHRTDFFVGIIVPVLAFVQNGDGAVADVIVELVQSSPNEPAGFIPGAALLQHSFQDADEKQGGE